MVVQCETAINSSESETIESNGLQIEVLSMGRIQDGEITIDRVDRHVLLLSPLGKPFPERATVCTRIQPWSIVHLMKNDEEEEAQRRWTHNHYHSQATAIH
jgi:hypothetical protein